MSIWDILNEIPEPLLMMHRRIGSLADDHPGSQGKDLTQTSKTTSVNDGVMGPISLRHAGSEAPHDDEEMAEDVMTDLGLAVKVKDERKLITFNIVNPSQPGLRKGFITIRKSDEAKGYWQIEMADLEVDNKMSLSGKGLGPELYVFVNDWLKKNKNSRLMSDTERTPPAEKMWQKLVNQGKAKKVSDQSKSWQGEPYDYYVMESIDTLFEARDIKRIVESVLVKNILNMSTVSSK